MPRGKVAKRLSVFENCTEDEILRLKSHHLTIEAIKSMPAGSLDKLISINSSEYKAANAQIPQHPCKKDQLLVHKLNIKTFNHAIVDANVENCLEHFYNVFNPLVLQACFCEKACLHVDQFYPQTARRAFMRQQACTELKNSVRDGQKALQLSKDSADKYAEIGRLAAHQRMDKCLATKEEHFSPHFHLVCYIEDGYKRHKMNGFLKWGNVQGAKCQDHARSVYHYVRGNDGRGRGLGTVSQHMHTHGQGIFCCFASGNKMCVKCTRLIDATMHHDFLTCKNCHETERFKSKWNWISKKRKVKIHTKKDFTCGDWMIRWFQLNQTDKLSNLSLIKYHHQLHLPDLTILGLYRTEYDRLRKRTNKAEIAQLALNYIRSCPFNWDLNKVLPEDVRSGLLTATVCMEESDDKDDMDFEETINIPNH